MQSVTQQSARTGLLRLIACGVVVVFVAAISTGCNDGRPRLVPVSGQVLIDGEPLKYGSIRFAPADARSSAGELDSEGRFTLTCYEDSDGAVIGLHRVSISSGESINEEQIRWHAPKLYSNHKLSGLEQEVTELTSTITINLTWDGKKPYVEGVRSNANGPAEDFE